MATILKGKIALVTGASSGLGKAVTDLLIEEEATVFALARSIQEITFPDLVTKVTLNIRNLNSINEAFTEIDKKTKRIDILVNCARRGLVKSLEETTREEIMDVFGINLKGNIYIAQEIIHILKTPTSIVPSEYVIERGF